jgi:dethiobiotin synthetase
MAASCAYFVTGTDTEVGKTLISSALLQVLSHRGLRTAGMKPVAAGAVMRDGAWHNDDVDQLAAASSLALPQALTTPYLLREAAAPHIAAELENIAIDAQHIRSCYDQVAAAADAVVVEGVGGFRVPLSDRFDTADLAQAFGLPVILVIGLRLGCLNHALLTADAIAARGLSLAGWVANGVIPEMPYAEANVAALAARLQAPPLGAVPWLAVPSAIAAADYLDFSGVPGWPGARSDLL